MHSKLQLLYDYMAFKSIEVIKSCLAFAVHFTRKKAHNILLLILDPMYKGLQMIIDYVEREKAMHIVIEYDQIVLVPLLVKCHTSRRIWHPHWRLMRAFCNRSSSCFEIFCTCKLRYFSTFLMEGYCPLIFARILFCKAYVNNTRFSYRDNVF